MLPSTLPAFSAAAASRGGGGMRGDVAGSAAYRGAAALRPISGEDRAASRLAGCLGCVYLFCLSFVPFHAVTPSRVPFDWRAVNSARACRFVRTALLQLRGKNARSAGAPGPSVHLRALRCWHSPAGAANVRGALPAALCGSAALQLLCLLTLGVTRGGVAVTRVKALLRICRCWWKVSHEIWEGGGSSGWAGDSACSPLQLPSTSAAAVYLHGKTLIRLSSGSAYLVPVNCGGLWLPAVTIYLSRENGDKISAWAMSRGRVVACTATYAPHSRGAVKRPSSGDGAC
jgi:hypothetical protein